MQNYYCTTQLCRTQINQGDKMAYTYKDDRPRVWKFYFRAEWISGSTENVFINSKMYYFDNRLNLPVIFQAKRPNIH